MTDCAPNHKPDSKINRVCQFANGMVIVFDQYGHQMAEYQGHRRDVEAKILAAGWVHGFNAAEVV